MLERYLQAPSFRDGRARGKLLWSSCDENSEQQRDNEVEEMHNDY